ncbi:MAG: peptidoglycan editing factor PgeF [Desulfobacterales bacterium]|nr:peptidoglycan editing factor PgeF [Desulfobacterales bacterium]
MLLNKENGMVFYTFPNLVDMPGMVHGIFTRNGGNSIGPFRSLNVSFGVGDDTENVLENRYVISKLFNGNGIVFARQDHGTDVIVFKEGEDSVSGENTKNPLVGDALISNKNQILLMIQVADCQPVMVYDPKQQDVANIHSGWRGSVKNIIGHTIRVMEDKFNCKSKDLIAGIGPSLGPCCAEFVNYQEEIPEQYWKYGVGENHFDLWELSKDQLCNTGVLPENICQSNICTKCHTEQFFSYRGEGTTGRFAAVIGLV